METSLNLHCPGCGAAIVPQLGCCHSCLTRAVQLQAARFGTELVCNACGALHVVVRTDPSRAPSMVIGRAPELHRDDDWEIDPFVEPEGETC